MSEPTVEWVAGRPAAALRPWVERYVGYRLAGFAPGVHRGLPSRHMTFIVSIGPRIDVAVHPDPRQGAQSYRAVIGGLQAAPALIPYGPRQEGVAIELGPLGSRALAGRPAAELWNLAVELSDVVGRRGDELWERLQDVAGWRERFAVCDEVLSHLSRERQAETPLARSWQALVASGGRLAVADLAAVTGWSRQHLGRRFRAELGVGPKLAARIVRFERARRKLLAGSWRGGLADLALECGYYDQAHLDRDFSRLAGCSPSELRATEVPSVQDEEAGEAAE